MITAGVVGRDTMVWTDGMAAWEALEKVRPDMAQPPPPPVLSPSSTAIPGAGQAVCAQCGQVVSTEDVVPLAGRMICARCKPLAVQMLKEGVSPVNSQAEQVRREHIKHEASILAVGGLQILGGVMCGLFGVGTLGGLGTGAFAGQGAPITALMAGMSVFYAAMAGLFLWVGHGLRRLNPAARTVAAVLSGIGLIGFPVGTLINGYILWLLFSRTGKRVFSEEYRRIIAETPHVKFRNPVRVWVILAFIIVGLVLFGAYFAWTASGVR